MRILLGLVGGLWFAGCQVAPDGTSVNRIYQSLYQVDHPEYGRPITMAEQRPDFTGTHPAPSRQGQAAWEADVTACVNDVDRRPRDDSLSMSDAARQYRGLLWGCIYAKGWRWDNRRPPGQ